MEPKAIQDLLTKEYNEFMRQPFPGAIPEWILTPLPKAIMSMPQSAVPYHAERILHILSKKYNELSTFELGVVINVLLAVRPEVFECEIVEFLQRRIELEAVRDAYTKITKEEENRLQRKKVALENAGGQMKNNNHNLTKA